LTCGVSGPLIDGLSMVSKCVFVLSLVVSMVVKGG
jgi:hypothetical protein